MQKEAWSSDGNVKHITLCNTYMYPFEFQVSPGGAIRKTKSSCGGETERIKFELLLTYVPL